MHGIPVYMSKRGLARRRAELERSQRSELPDRMARVQVSPETWAVFRAQLGATPVSAGLGRLVEHEVARSLRRSKSDSESVRVALEDARQLADELASLIARLERTAATAPDGPVGDKAPVLRVHDAAPADDRR